MSSTRATTAPAKSTDTKLKEVEHAVHRPASRTSRAKLLHRRGAHADRRRQAPRPHPGRGRLAHRRQGARPRARSWSTSPPSTPASPRKSAARSSNESRGLQVRRGLQPRLLARAHQPRRQGAHLRAHREGRVGAGRGDPRARRRASTARWSTAGVHRAASIKVAEAAKVIENTQRDLNIALMNELALIFDRIGIRTRTCSRPPAPSGTSSRSRPGLVGGHCIGVDPYYLTAKAEQLGYQPAGHPRRPPHQQRHGRLHRPAHHEDAVARRTSPCAGPRVGILGLTFKENVPDLRNSRVPDIVDRAARVRHQAASIHDPTGRPRGGPRGVRHPAERLGRADRPGRADSGGRRTTPTSHGRAAALLGRMAEGGVSWSTSSRSFEPADDSTRPSATGACRVSRYDELRGAS